jgi:hypothetical protein
MKMFLSWQQHFDFLATQIGELGDFSKMSGCATTGGAEKNNAWRHGFLVNKGTIKRLK